MKILVACEQSGKVILIVIGNIIALSVMAGFLILVVSAPLMVAGGMTFSLAKIFGVIE